MQHLTTQEKGIAESEQWFDCVYIAVSIAVPLLTMEACFESRPFPFFFQQELDQMFCTGFLEVKRTLQSIVWENVFSRGCLQE